MDIEEGEEVQAKITQNIVSKTTAENFQISRNRCSSRYKKSLRHQTHMNKIEPLYGII
jgi:hypothetical protein